MRVVSFRSLAASVAAGALSVGFALSTPAPASAASMSPASAAERLGSSHAGQGPTEMQRRVYRGGGRHYGYRRGWRGPGGAAIGLGIAGAIIGGAAAAAAAQPYRECWIERQWVDTPWGPEPRRVRVCN